MDEDITSYLYKLGWKDDFSYLRKCRVCHKNYSNTDFGWSSPCYSFYHRECFESSKRYKKLLSEFAKQKGLK